MDFYTPDYRDSNLESFDLYPATVTTIPQFFLNFFYLFLRHLSIRTVSSTPWDEVDFPKSTMDVFHCGYFSMMENFEIEKQKPTTENHNPWWICDFHVETTEYIVEIWFSSMKFEAGRGWTLMGRLEALSDRDRLRTPDAIVLTLECETSTFNAKI